mmetsp:Transcript_29238/g.56948  ORF Transcript_29238/g.56948 Transcript_29238/m.56948 type:complete len:241 (+) Transcript_29238:59-781(+)
MALLDDEPASLQESKDANRGKPLFAQIYSLTRHSFHVLLFELTYAECYVSLATIILISQAQNEGFVFLLSLVCIFFSQFKTDESSMTVFFPGYEKLRAHRSVINYIMFCSNQCALALLLAWGGSVASVVMKGMVFIAFFLTVFFTSVLLYYYVNNCLQVYFIFFAQAYSVPIMVLAFMTKEEIIQIDYLGNSLRVNQHHLGGIFVCFLLIRIFVLLYFLCDRDHYESDTFRNLSEQKKNQ